MTDADLNALVMTLARVQDSDLESFPPPGLAQEWLGVVEADGPRRIVEDATGVSPILDRPPAYVPAVRRRAVAIAVAAVVLIGVVASASVVLTHSGSDDHPDDRVRVSTATTLPAPVLPPALCGSGFPHDLNIPDTYAGPTTSVQPVDTDPLGPGRLVLTWRAPTGSIELHWPASDLGPQPAIGGSGATPTGSNDSFVGIGSPGVEILGDGRSREYMTFREPSVAPAGSPTECQWWGWQVVDSNADTVRTVAERLRARLFRLNPANVVMSTMEVDVIPSASTCPVPAGAPLSPNRGGPIEGFGIYPSPREALIAFTEPRTSLPREGYAEMRLPDGTTAYAWPIPNRGGYAVVVHAMPVPGGWTVDRFETSGC